MKLERAILLTAIGAVAGSSLAANIDITTDIAVSTTWTADNVYNLTKQIYVLPGATLTIEPGTLIASATTVNGAGSLAVTRGAKIMAKGSRQNPIIFTSTSDDLVNWRPAASEWGNVTIMGRAYISYSFLPGNTKTCNPSNICPMEGLIAAFPGDPNVFYGGGDDDDDSGCLEYVSLRYGGRVVGLADELNGLSLGGIGRETDISFVEIMNNVDDGIEIWGGTVNLKYVSVWNIGDDSIDLDQGWRGKAQFGLVVQGYSVIAAQGSGIGDHCFEMDGAEDSDAQPVTTAAIYNFTVIGQPLAGRAGTAWRDNCRVQFRQSIFMDLGQALVRFDNAGGATGGFATGGYGFNGTLTWPQTWQTDWNVYSNVNACPDPAELYQAQVDGKLAEIRDCVFFRNNAANAYTEATARGVFDPSNNNVLMPTVIAPDPGPITQLDRVVVAGTNPPVLRVTKLDPRARIGTPAEISRWTAPDDGFYCPVDYRGAFSPTENWLCNWTAADAYGFIVAPDGVCVNPVCPVSCEPSNGDLDGNGVVDGADLGTLLSEWGNAGGPADLNCDGVVDGADLGIQLSNWG
jgi:hypothetical protein